MNDYGISEYCRPLPDMDSWLRRRVRMRCWKQWRRCRTRVGHLIRLGAPAKHAVMCGLSRKACRHLTRTLGTQSGMTDRWPAEQGLLAVRDPWIAVHYPPDKR